jgi:hypothetical protein
MARNTARDLSLPACGETVGVRGDIRERVLSKVPLTRRAFAALRRVDLCPQAGRGERGSDKRGHDGRMSGAIAPC